MSSNPIFVSFNAHPQLAKRLREFSRDGNMSAAGREILHHVTKVEHSESVAALLKSDKPTIQTREKPGLHRTAPVGLSIAVAAADVLTARAANMPLAVPVRNRTHFNIEDLSRHILEAALLSPEDQKRVRTRAGKQGRTEGTTKKPMSVLSVYVSEETDKLLEAKLAGARIGRSYFVSLLVEDAMNGTNKAVRVLQLHPSAQPERRSMSADAALQ